jgi:hypothetical protein
MTDLIWHRDQQSDVQPTKADLAYKCWRSSHGKVYLPADIAPDSIFLSDSMIANLKAIAAERIGP